MAFSIQLLPLNITFSRFIHVIHMNPYSIVFLWPKKLHSMDIPLSFIHTSVNRHSFKVAFSSVKFSSVDHSCLTLCDPMSCSTPGLPVHHQLPEFTQTHVHRVGDSIQPSHPLLSPSLPAPNPSQHQGLFQ